MEEGRLIGLLLGMRMCSAQIIINAVSSVKKEGVGYYVVEEGWVGHKDIRRSLETSIWRADGDSLYEEVAVVRSVG